MGFTKRFDTGHLIKKKTGYFSNTVSDIFMYICVSGVAGRRVSYQTLPRIRLYSVLG